MEVVFTICSNNYLAHAATLVESWFSVHTETVFYIILVDKKDAAVDYTIVLPAQVIEIEDIGILNFKELVENYNITELNTAVKPDVFLYLFKKYENSKIIYLDPDILVTGKFSEVFNALDHNDFVLTPHICFPIDDDKAPTDYHTLRTGIFNLGFIALKYTEQVRKFLIWWKERVYKYGYCDLPANMFYDQLWTNFIPVFYDNYCILKHQGYNMANWNLHERNLSEVDSGVWMVNEKEELKFFHFSGYKFNQPNNIGSYHTRYNFNSRPDLKAIFDLYHSKLISHGADKLYNVPCVYFEKHKSIKLEKQLIIEKTSQNAMSFKMKVIRKAAYFARKIIYK